LTNLSAVPAQQQEAALHQALAELTGRPFSLAEGPLVRMDLLRLSETVHVVLLHAPESVLDGWSARLLLEELTACFPAHPAGPPAPTRPPAPPPPLLPPQHQPPLSARLPAGPSQTAQTSPTAQTVPWSEYARWERAVADGHALDAHLAYWRSQLAGAPALLE